MAIRSFAIAIFALCVPISSALADLIILQPSKDNTLIQTATQANQLSNGQGDIFVGRTNQDGSSAATISIRRGLISFDVASSLPSQAVISSVTLTMRDVMGQNGSRAISLYRTQQDWGEGSSFVNGGMGAAAKDGDATWYYTKYIQAAPSSSTLWTTPGGNFAATSSATTTVNGVSAANYTWSSAAMTSDVQGWLNNPTTNFGWTILGDESMGMTSDRFASGESATNAPTLSITYTAVPEPASSTILGISVAAFFVRRRLRKVPRSSLTT